MKIPRTDSDHRPYDRPEPQIELVLTILGNVKTHLAAGDTGAAAVEAYFAARHANTLHNMLTGWPE